MAYRFLCAVGMKTGTAPNVQGGTKMGETRGDARRLVGRLVAAVAVSDLAYRLFVRASLRRALGIEVKHA
jgi:hypothetical protein